MSKYKLILFNCCTIDKIIFKVNKQKIRLVHRTEMSSPEQVDPVTSDYT